MHSSKAFIWLSVAAGLLTALVSLLGTIDPGTYGKETLNWRAQAIGQDYVNLFVAFPVLLVSSLLVLRRDSYRAFLIMLGVLIYLIYSYILYSFFVHFGPLFLFYVAILGLSFYSLVGNLVRLDWHETGQLFDDVKIKPASMLLLTVAILFSLLWLADIAGALAKGVIPKDLDNAGLIINPIHVLDLAILLPGTFVVAISLWQKKTPGLTLAVPLLVFFVLMGTAIISMMIVAAQKGFDPAWPQVLMMGVIIVLSLILGIQYLRRIH